MTSRFSSKCYAISQQTKEVAKKKSVLVCWKRKWGCFNGLIDPGFMLLINRKEGSPSFFLILLLLKSSLMVAISNTQFATHLVNAAPLVHWGPIEVDLTLPPEHPLLVEIQQHPDYLPEDSRYRPFRLEAWLHELHLKTVHFSRHFECTLDFLANFTERGIYLHLIEFYGDLVCARLVFLLQWLSWAFASWKAWLEIKSYFKYILWGFGTSLAD